MKFPNVLSIPEYCGLLAGQKCEIVAAEDTGRFAPHVDLYLNMLDMQLSYDALKIIGFNQSLMQAMAEEMKFLQELAHAGKIAQGLFVARKPRGVSGFLVERIATECRVGRGSEPHQPSPPAPLPLRGRGEKTGGARCADPPYHNFQVAHVPMLRRKT